MRLARARSAIEGRTITPLELLAREAERAEGDASSPGKS
jgi:hypothetical protein